MRLWLILVLFLCSAFQVAKSEVCKAAVGRKYKPCQFPFKVNGTEYDGCIKGEGTDEEPWCVTRDGEEGICSPDCPEATLLQPEDVDLPCPQDVGRSKADPAQSNGPKVYGGKDAAPLRFPYQAVLYKNGTYDSFCGGSLISDSFVLTAAHCVSRPPLTAKEIYVKLGEYDTSNSLDKEIQVAVSEIIIHKDYMFKEDTNRIENDMALLKLFNRINISASVSPICIPNNTITSNVTTIKVSGFGFVDLDNQKTSKLKTADLSVFVGKECLIVTNYSKSQICVKSRESRATRGDSGGPMVGSWNNAKYLIGVISYLKNHISVGMKVSEYIKWIEEKTGSPIGWCNANPFIIESVEITTRVKSRISSTTIASQINNPSSGKNEIHCITNTDPKSYFIDPIYLSMNLIVNSGFPTRTSFLILVPDPHFMPQEVSYRFFIPDSGIVSELEMTLDKKTYAAKLEEASEASKIYSEHKGSAALLKAARNSPNEVVLTAIAAPHQTINFTLAYEDFLIKNDSMCTIRMGMILKQPALQFHINIQIEDKEEISIQTIKDRFENIKGLNQTITSGNSRSENGWFKKGVFITVPALRSLHKNFDSGKSFHELEVVFSLKDSNGANKNETDLKFEDGYFLYYFPTNKHRMFPKIIVFVLDISGSMYGRPLEQTKNAVITILQSLNDYDKFCIVLFHSFATFLTSPTLEFATDSYKNKVQKLVMDIQVLGATNIFDGLDKAFSVLNANSLAFTDKRSLPMIFFMTDGYSNEGVVGTENIVREVKRLNKFDIPIYGIGFGHGADFELVKSVASSSGANAIRIHTDDEAYLEFENFYFSIPTPILTHVKLSTNCAAGLSNITIAMKDTFYGNRDNFIVGRQTSEKLKLEISGLSVTGPFNATIEVPALQPDQEKCINPGRIERLWAYLMVKQYLGYKSESFELMNSTCGVRNLNDQEKITLAKTLSMRHGFITDVTSAVVLADQKYIKPTQEVRYSLANIELLSSFTFSDYLTLFDTTFLRGSSLKITESISNLAYKQFHDRATSFSIDGTACWTFYEIKDFQGRSQMFKPGKYPSALQLGKFFKNIGSIKKLDSCPS